MLFAQEVLALDAFGFGLLSTAAAVGGILGSQFTGPLTGMLGHGPVLLLSLAIPGAAFIGVALTSQAWHVGALFVVSGFFIVGWNVVTVSLRQRIAPTGMLGRTNSVYRFLGWGLAPIGTRLGELLASGDARPLRGSAVGAVPAVKSGVRYPAGGLASGSRRNCTACAFYSGV